MYRHLTLTPRLIGIVSDLMFWGMIETGTAVVASCLPTMLPAMRAVGNAKPLQKVRGSLTRLLTMRKDSVASGDKIKRDRRSESTATINAGVDGRSSGESGNRYELRPVRSAGGEGIDAPKALGEIEMESGYTVEHMV